MDNEAFRALVQERTREKTTKEIAREAVEEEFRRDSKRKKRASESDSDDDNVREKRRPRDSLMVPAAAQRRRKQQEHDSKYRDRAKERREGKNVDYDGTKSLLEGVAAAAEDGVMDRTTLSKYLGGDEEHTHLVKGLDVALVRKLKREMGRNSEGVSGEPDLEQVLQDAKRRQNGEGPSRSLSETRQDAQNFLEQAVSGTVSTSLGRDMLSYLQSVHLPPAPLSSVGVSQSPAGYAIQRSHLTFSTMDNPGDRIRSWEVPYETTRAGGELDSIRSVATPLDNDLLARIRQTLSSRAQDEKMKSNSELNSSVGQNGHDESVSANRPEVDEESDDDIFKDAGRYVPSSQAPAPPRGGNKKPVKGSIFTGLSDSQAETTEAPGNAVSIVLAARRQESRSVLQGVSVSGYDGGYGEEMDVDFDGRLAVDEEEEGKGKKKNRKEETTVAASEYGAGRGKK